MKQDVDNSYSMVCSSCLSGDRNIFAINNLSQIYQVFRLLTYDFAGDRFGDTLEMELLVCWECLALLKKFSRFKQQVHRAQDHLRSVDHTYMSQSLSSLGVSTKIDYDKMYFDYTTRDEQWPTQYIASTDTLNVKTEQFDVAHDEDIVEHKFEVHENPVTGVMPHFVVGTDTPVSTVDTYTHVKEEGRPLIVSPMTETNKATKSQAKLGYVTEYMSETDLLACREEAKQKVQYVYSEYKCELCIIGFDTQQQVGDHFVSAHTAKPGFIACKVCYVYIDESKIHQHLDEHYFRYTCMMCSHVEFSVILIGMHVKTHISKALPSAVNKIGDTAGGKEFKAFLRARGGLLESTAQAERSLLHNASQKTVETTFNSLELKSKKNKKQMETPASPPKQTRMRSKITIEGYQCLECDMFFQKRRARQHHVYKHHREGFQCDHCKKKFFTKSLIIRHLRLHEGPLPREECPICHKMVCAIQLKYHIQRHENKTRHVCVECDKVFSNKYSYLNHLKYSRAHVQGNNVFKFPCPMCNKGYPTKERMQDHFNYQHLGKTTHKCPICAKPIATRRAVQAHMRRVHGHGEKKAKPRNHCCEECGKAFTDKKTLVRHIVIHSGERPLSCEICQQTFKQHAALYTHRKRVHKVLPPKKVVEYMEAKPDGS